jgi:adenosylcobinamide-GDP ribazoletransferase
MDRFLGALQFLTIVPVSRSSPPLGQCALFFPLVGALIGLLAGAAGTVVDLILPPMVAAFVATVLATWLGGGLHEDGLADVADGIRPGRSVQRMLDIMQDSRLGTYGTCAIVLTLLGRWVGSAESVVPLYLAWMAAKALGQAGILAAAYYGTPVGEGLGTVFSEHLRPIPIVAAILSALAIAFAAMPVRIAVLAACGTALTVLWMGAWFQNRLGGITGDCLGAVGVMAEVQALLWTAMK